MAKSSRVYIPSDMNVNFGPSKEYPDGRVVSLKQGIVDLDEDLSAHPVIAHLQTVSPVTQAREEKVLAAAQARSEAVAKADTAYADAVAAADKEAADENHKLAEEWNKRAQEAAEKQQPFSEPHPDPATARAIALTSQVGPAPVGTNLARVGESVEAHNGTSRTHRRVRIDHHEEHGSGGDTPAPVSA